MSWAELPQSECAILRAANSVGPQGSCHSGPLGRTQGAHRGFQHVSLVVMVLSLFQVIVGRLWAFFFFW